MSEQTPVPKDHPLMIAWEAFKRSEDYANALRWLERGNYDGELWCAFEHGFRAAAETHQAHSESMVDLSMGNPPKEPHRTQQMFACHFCGCSFPGPVGYSWSVGGMPARTFFFCKAEHLAAWHRGNEPGL